MLPRLPLVEDVRDFWKFSKTGRELAELHINYEKLEAFKGVKVTSAEATAKKRTVASVAEPVEASDAGSTIPPTDKNIYQVEKMRFPKKDQKDTILYNSKITISNIPVKAYEYVVNGKSAIEWIMERYQV